MLLTIFKSKIHRATVTEANLNYVGSITIDEDLMDAAQIYPGEKLQIVNVNNGERIETYAIWKYLPQWSRCQESRSRRCRHTDILCLDDSGRG